MQCGRVPIISRPRQGSRDDCLNNAHGHFATSPSEEQNDCLIIVSTVHSFRQKVRHRWQPGAVNKLSNSSVIFRVLMQAQQVGSVTQVCLFFYFVTSSDSGSMIVDMNSANGFDEPPIPQRIFWSAMEGLLEIALLNAGRNLPDSEGSLRALQSLYQDQPDCFVPLQDGVFVQSGNHRHVF